MLRTRVAKEHGLRIEKLHVYNAWVVEQHPVTLSLVNH